MRQPSRQLSTASRCRRRRSRRPSRTTSWLRSKRSWRVPRRRGRRRNKPPRVIHIYTMGPRTPVLPEARCPLSGKRSFETEDDALSLAAAWAYHNSAEYGSAYLCQCGSWHLTKRFRKDED